MYCILDTETSGLFDFSRPADAEGQPRLASIAMLLADDGLNLVAATSVLIRPDGWEMSREAEAVNGLSQALLNEHGVPICGVLSTYENALRSGDIVVAHNAQFDTKVMRGPVRHQGDARRDAARWHDGSVRADFDDLYHEDSHRSL